MLLSTFLNIVAACVGFLSATFFALGVLRTQPAAIYAIAKPKWDFNPSLADSIAEQRANYIVGAPLLVLSFSLQLSANLVPPTLQPSLLQPVGCVLVSIGLAFSAIALLSRYLCRRIAEKTKQTVRQIEKARKAQKEQDLKDRVRP
jgi:protein-S-isoprenylcysteine O-methyltransferase Ste14